MAQIGPTQFTELFRQLDLDGSGSICRNQFTSVLIKANIFAAPELVEAFCGQNDTTIKYKAFLDWLCSQASDTNQDPVDSDPKDMISSLKHGGSRTSSKQLQPKDKYRRSLSALSSGTEAYVDGSLQDKPQTPYDQLSLPPRPTAQVSVDFGSCKFKGVEADTWLRKFGLCVDVLDDMTWTVKHADAVAAAVASWAMARGATMVCHWSQPMRSATGTWRSSKPAKMVHALFNPGVGSRAVCILDGSYLLHGEGDSRKMIDVTSAMWVQDDTLFIPSVMVNYNNSSFHDCDPVLCQKTPLLRAMHAVSEAGVRLLRLLGHSCTTVLPKIGLEQEFFLIPRAAYDRRLDLQRCGRTLLGVPPAHGSCFYDTHSEPMNTTARRCMTEIQSECFKLGIHLRTRHRESAPNQYEYAPHFGVATAQVDENLVIMEIIEEVAQKYGLAALLHEKPFAGVSGSGKHNNFSLGTDTGLNLFNEVHTNHMIGGDKQLGQYEAFPVIMAAVCSAVYRHGNLLMASVACPGNDIRLSKTGGYESPPMCISIHLGESLTAFLTEFAESTAPLSKPFIIEKTKVLLGIPAIDQHGISVSSEARNRTAPLPFAGRRFELRSVGSSQNVGMVNTVLCTCIAEAFNAFAEEIESGSTPRQVASKALKEGGGLKAVFNDNNYTAEWRADAEARGLVSVDSMVDAICQLQEEKSLALFESLGVMSREELGEHVDVLLENYCITVQIEARCMLDMVCREIIPAVEVLGLDRTRDVLAKLTLSVTDMEKEVKKLHDIEEMEEQAKQAFVLRLTTMPAVRSLCDQLENLVPFSQWPVAHYHEMLFDDMKHCK